METRLHEFDAGLQQRLLRARRHRATVEPYGGLQTAAYRVFGLESPAAVHIISSSSLRGHGSYYATHQPRHDESIDHCFQPISKLPTASGLAKR